MALAEKIRDLSVKIGKLASVTTTEEAAKNAFVLPFT